MRNQAGEKGETEEARAKGKHRGNSCGSETGRDERKQTESRVQRNGREAWETRWNGSGKAKKSKDREAAPEKAAVRRSGEERGKEETEAE